jgi:hypothetical protein
MKQISEVDEKPFTLSLDIRPEGMRNEHAKLFIKGVELVHKIQIEAFSSSTPERSRPNLKLLQVLIFKILPRFKKQYFFGN